MFQLNYKIKSLQKQSYTGWPQKTNTVLYALTLSNIDRFSNLFHNLNQDNICNNTVTIDPATPQECRYTTLWNVSVLKATIENKTTSAKTHFKKQRVYCLSYYLK